MGPVGVALVRLDNQFSLLRGREAFRMGASHSHTVSRIFTAIIGWEF